MIASASPARLASPALQNRPVMARRRRHPRIAGNRGGVPQEGRGDKRIHDSLTSPSGVWTKFAPECNG